MVRFTQLNQGASGDRFARFQKAIELEIALEAASSLGLSGERLQKSLAALADFDATAGNPARRDELLATAREALWAYVVQRELLGLQDMDYICAAYGVPSEVKSGMGPRPAR